MRGVLVVVMLSAALAAPALAASASKETVLAILRARETQPMRAADWRKLGDGVDALLDQAFRDRSLLVAHRARALGALAGLGGPRASRTLAEVLRDGQAEPALLAVAVEAFAAYLGAAHPTAALAHGKRLLTHEDWLVRRAAARALGRLGTPSARSVLEARRAGEDHGAVMAAIDEPLR